MFNNIVGNNKITEELINLINTNKYPSSMIFQGISGIGKKMIAREFAKMILCTSKKKYCNKCKSCIEFNTNNNPDFTEIKPDGNTIKIEQIRELLRKAYEMPIISHKKVYIIDDADCATIEAQNALLKTLEEPPEFLNIVLIGENESKFLSTIKSRCMTIKFEKINNMEIKAYFQNELKISQISENIVNAANGSLGKAIKLNEKQNLYESIDKIFENIEKTDLIEILKNAEIIYKSQDDKLDILDYINTILFKNSKKNSKYLNCINFVEQAKIRINVNSNYNMSIDNMLISIWEEMH